MSGLLFLTADDFDVQPGTKGNILCTNIPGFSLILFYSTHCKYCHDLIPQFKVLPDNIAGCQFGMINVSTNKTVVEKARDTVTPISYVPLMILYINGRPFMIYKGPCSKEEIGKFVIEVTNNVQKKQQFSQGKVTKPDETSIPAYSIGIPIKGNMKDLVCYLEYGDAYGGNKK